MCRKLLPKMTGNLGKRWTDYYIITLRFKNVCSGFKIKNWSTPKDQGESIRPSVSNVQSSLSPDVAKVQCNLHWCGVQLFQVIDWWGLVVLAAGKFNTLSLSLFHPIFPSFLTYFENTSNFISQTAVNGCFPLSLCFLSCSWRPLDQTEKCWLSSNKNICPERSVNSQR